MQTIPTAFNVKHPRILDLDTVRKLAPAVFAEKPASHVSEAYNFIRTSEILETLQSKGWGTIFAQQQKSRNPNGILETKHALSMVRMGEDIQNLAIGGLLPTINLINSHNWSSTFRIVFGMLRLVCSNGLMVGGAEFQSFTLRHDSLMGDLELTLARFQSSVSRMMECASNWAQIQLPDDAVQTFAMSAAKIRFGEEKATPEHARTLLNSRRYEDAGNSLWNVYNRLQENGIKGGFRGGLQRRMRALTNIQASQDYNTGLFDLASRTALSWN